MGIIQDIRGNILSEYSAEVRGNIWDCGGPLDPIIWLNRKNCQGTWNSIAEVLGIIKTIRPVCGTPQGGVLSSRIWNLSFDPLLKLLNENSPCSPVGFADDGALCFRGIDPNTLVDNAQLKLNQAIEWGAQNGLFLC